MPPSQGTTAPITTPTPPAQSPLIVTGTNPANEFAQNQQELQSYISSKGSSPTTTIAGNGAASAPVDTTNPVNPDGTTNMNYSDSYTQALNRMAATSDQATKNLIASIQATRQNSANDLNAKYDTMKDGLFSLGIDTGQLQTSPSMVYGKEIASDNARASQLADLDSKEAKAISDAQVASTNKDNTTLKEKLTYINSVQQQKLAVLTSDASQLNAASTISKDLGQSIYDNLQSVPQSQKLNYMTEIVKQYNTAHPGANVDLHSVQAQVNKLADKGSKAASTKVNENVATSQLTPQFDAIKGTDGYIDPAKWVAGRTKWESLGYSAASYNRNFKQYLNPASYSKAGFNPPAASKQTS